MLCFHDPHAATTGVLTGRLITNLPERLATELEMLLLCVLALSTAFMSVPGSTTNAYRLQCVALLGATIAHGWRESISHMSN